MSTSVLSYKVFSNYFWLQYERNNILCKIFFAFSTPIFSSLFLLLLLPYLTSFSFHIRQNVTFIYNFHTTSLRSDNIVIIPLAAFLLLVRYNFVSEIKFWWPAVVLCFWARQFTLTPCLFNSLHPGEKIVPYELLQKTWRNVGRLGGEGASGESLTDGLCHPTENWDNVFTQIRVSLW